VSAFEDYWCLGHARSISKLAAQYRRRSDGGEDVPTVRERTLEDWSATFHWRERAAQRERDEAAEAERRNRERTQRFRERVMRAIDIDASAYLQKVSAAVGPNGELGEPGIILSASDLSKAVATFLQLAGEPQRHQVSASTIEMRVDGSPNGNLAAVVATIAEVAHLIPDLEAAPPGLAESEEADAMAIGARRERW
jgi:hypothetical protein